MAIRQRGVMMRSWGSFFSVGRINAAKKRMANDEARMTKATSSNDQATQHRESPRRFFGHLALKFIRHSILSFVIHLSSVLV
jgi:hypothetical protein